MGITPAVGTANRTPFLEFAELLSAAMPEPQLVDALATQGQALSSTAGGELERS